MAHICSTLPIDSSSEWLAGKAQASAGRSHAASLIQAAAAIRTAQLNGSAPDQQPDLQAQLSKQVRQHGAEHYFDLKDIGSYPPRQHLYETVWKDLQDSHNAAGKQQDSLQQASAEATAESAEQDPFAWVPGEQQTDDAEESFARVRPKSAQIRSKTATTLPLEFFDSPEMEQCDVDQRLFEAQAAGKPGLAGFSRFYDPQGAFSWAPCTVLQYDRCAGWQ